MLDRRRNGPSRMRSIVGHDIFVVKLTSSRMLKFGRRVRQSGLSGKRSAFVSGTELDERLPVRYRRAWAAVLSLGVIWNATTILQIIQYKLSNRRKEQAWTKLTVEQREGYLKENSNEPISKRLDARYAL